MRAVFLYEKARLLIEDGMTNEALQAVDRLVVEPGHPRFECEAPPPSAVHLYPALAERDMWALSARAKAHERAGRLLEAALEAEAASDRSILARLQSRLEYVTVDVAPERAGEAPTVRIDNATYGPGWSFACTFIATPRRTILIEARTPDGWAGEVTHYLSPAASTRATVTLRDPREPPPPDVPAAGDSTPAPAVPAETGHAFIYGSIGLGGGYLAVDGPTGPSKSGAGHLGGALFVLADSRWASYAWNTEGVVGGGSDGVETIGRTSFELGGRLPIHDSATSGHGLFLRAGIAARFMGNNAVQIGALDLPTGSAGYSLFGDKVAVQVGMRAAPTLIGRFAVGDVYNRDDARRRYEVAATYGPFAGIHVGPAHFDGLFARSAGGGGEPGTPVDMFQGTACITVTFLGLCGHGSYMRSDVSRDPKTVPWSEANALYLGATAVIAIDSNALPTAIPAFMRRN